MKIDRQEDGIMLTDFEGVQGNILLSKLKDFFRYTNLQVKHLHDENGVITHIRMFMVECNVYDTFTEALYFVTGFASGWNESTEYRTETANKEDPRVLELKTRLKMIGYDLSPSDMGPNSYTKWRVHHIGYAGGCYFTSLKHVEGHVSYLEGVAK
jgi:hypothetical protein